MPSNKNAYIRYLTIDKCLREKGKATKEQLMQAIRDAIGSDSIKERTFQDDLRNMKHDSGLKFYAPIIRSRRDSAYYYDDKYYSIEKSHLGDEEKSAFIFAGKIMASFKDTIIFEHFNEAALRVIRADEKKPDIENIIPYKHIIFETENTQLSNLTVIIKALDNEVLEIEYESPCDKSKHNIIFHPYKLYNSGGTWKLKGYSETDSKGISILLSDIVSATDRPLLTFLRRPSGN